MEGYNVEEREISSSLDLKVFGRMSSGEEGKNGRDIENLGKKDGGGKENLIVGNYIHPCV